MALFPPLQLDRLPSLVAALALLALAAWVIALDPSRKLHRRLALLLFLRSLFLGLLALSALASDLPGRLRPYLAIAIPFAAAGFAVAYREWLAAPSPTSRRRHQRAQWLILALLVAFELLLVWRPQLFFDPPFTPGPLSLFIPLAYATFAFIAVLFARDAFHAASGPRRRALLLGSLAFAVEPAYQATWQLAFTGVVLAEGGPIREGLLATPITVVERLIWIAPLALLAAVVVALGRHARQAEPAPERGEARRYLAVMALAPATALAVVAAYAVRGGPTSIASFVTAHLALDAAWTLIAPLLITYALVRHRFLDVDVKVRWTLRQSTVAGIFVAVFFIVSESAAEVFEARVGPFVGIIGAGVLLFFLHPILNVAQRLAHKAVPPQTPLEERSREDRRRIYREMIELAWYDGSVTRSERRVLEVARRELGLTVDESHGIEHAVLAQAPPEPPPADAEDQLRAPARRREKS